MNIKKAKVAVEEHKCELHIRRYADGQYLASYSYRWGEDASCQFTLLSEVAESLQDAFAYIIKSRGLMQFGPRFTKVAPFAQDRLVPDERTPAGHRWLSLVPAGIPRWVRCYDNGGVDAGGSIDCYTAVFTGRAAPTKYPAHAAQWPYLAMNAAPFHPQGFGHYGYSDHQPCDVNKYGWAPAVGRKNHLGKRIEFTDLPEDCQRFVFSYYIAIWQL